MPLSGELKRKKNPNPAKFGFFWNKTKKKIKPSTKFLLKTGLGGGPLFSHLNKQSGVLEYNPVLGPLFAKSCWLGFGGGPKAGKNHLSREEKNKEKLLKIFKVGRKKSFAFKKSFAPPLFVWLKRLGKGKKVYSIKNRFEKMKKEKKFLKNKENRKTLGKKNFPPL